MPIKDEELRKIIEILVNKDKEKKRQKYLKKQSKESSKKMKKKRKKEPKGTPRVYGEIRTTSSSESPQAISGRPALMGGFGGYNYWGGGGGGPLGPTRQEIQNLIQSNLTATQVPLAVPQSAAIPVPTSLAGDNIVYLPERNIVIGEEIKEGGKWTYEDLAADTYGNFAGGVSGDEFLDPQQVAVAMPYGEKEVLTDQAVGDITQEEMTVSEPTASDVATGFLTQPDDTSESEDTSPVKGRNRVVPLPAIPEERTKRKYVRKTFEEKEAERIAKEERASIREQRRVEKQLKALGATPTII